MRLPTALLESTSVPTQRSWSLNRLYLNRKQTQLTVGGHMPEHDRLFDEVVSARGAALKRFAYLLSGDRDTAEDLVQEALLRALSGVRWRQRGSPEQLEAYVRRTIVNLVVDSSRRRRYWALRLPKFAASNPDGGVDVGTAVCERVSLRESLAALPPRQRACLVMRYYEDLPVAEIADRLGCSHGTVKSQIHDARRSLARSWVSSDVDHDKAKGG